MRISSHLTYKFLSEELYEYLDAAIMVQTSPEEAYRKVRKADGSGEAPYRHRYRLEYLFKLEVMSLYT